MKTELLERRSYMLNHYGKFFSLKDAVTDTAQKFGVKTSTLYVDWNRRGKWIKTVSGLKDRTSTIDFLIQRQFQLLKDLEVLKYEADNDNAKVGALRTQANVSFNLIRLLRELRKEEGGDGPAEIKLSWVDRSQEIKGFLNERVS